MSQATAEQMKSIPMSADRYKPEAIKQLVTNIATASDVSESDAAIFADALVDADIHGISTHGISRLFIYIRRIQEKLINPSAEFKVEQQLGSTMVVDAGNGLGQVQAVKTLKKLMPMAENNGIAACTVKNSQHFGALSYYCNMAAEHNMILLATTNCEPSMAPSGASEAFFGTNPIACSFPTDRGYPVKIDLATSRVARGNIIEAQKRGESIPPDWALSKNGNSTTNAAEALAGIMLPMAGHKGYALALMVEILSGVLSGAAIGPAIGSMYNDMDRKQNVGHFFCLLNISAFLDVSEFKHRIGETIEGIKACRKRPGVKDILIPGERSYQRARQNRKHGILVEEATRKELKLLCEELRIEFPLDK